MHALNLETGLHVSDIRVFVVKKKEGKFYP